MKVRFALFVAVLCILGSVFVFQNCASKMNTQDSVSADPVQVQQALDAVANNNCSSEAIASGAPLGSAELTLFDFVAFSSEGIASQSSGYDGLVGSAGDISLQDFLIQRDTSVQNISKPFSECNTYSRTQVFFTGGSVKTKVADALNDSCIEAPRVDADRVIFSGSRPESSVNYERLTAEMQFTSKRLSGELAQKYGSRSVTNNEFTATKDINIFSVTAEHLNREDRITFTGNANQIFVINVTGKKIEFRNKGIYRNGTLQPSHILWNFVDAEEIVIRDSGADDAAFGYKVGVPGTILAPKALVSFYRSAITGALYAKYINGTGREGVRQSGLIAVDTINPGGALYKQCFQGGALAVGCLSGNTCQRPAPPARVCVASTNTTGGKAQSSAQSASECLTFCRSKGDFTDDQRREWNVCWFDTGFVFEGQEQGQACVPTTDHQGGRAQAQKKETAGQCLEYCRTQGSFTRQERRDFNLCWYGDKFIFETEPFRGYSCVATNNRSGGLAPLVKVANEQACRDHCGTQGDFTAQERKDWNICWFEDHFIFE